jgi:predicted N-acetyltransferase YhbS
MQIRPAHSGDTRALLDVERAAFGGEAEADLVAALLGDPSALPIINLVAEKAGTVVGHVLFTRAVVDCSGADGEATILAPLAVLPESQRTGVGIALCREGIAAAERLGIGLVFVLGHIGYYPKLGFRPASALGLDAPYPIDPAVADAWMVLETRPGLIGSVRGTVICADALMSPEMWAE